MQERAVAEFERRFGSAPEYVVRAPGRVNLIGDHTDYNDGFVLPLAIDRAIWIALRRRDDRQVLVHAVEYDERAGFPLDDLAKDGPQWLEYVRGVAWALTEAGHRLQGWEGVIAGDVPVGAALSSSAALELAALRAFATVSDLPWDAPAMAVLGQRAENGWVGMNCGIMDQMISACGVEGHALLIDCRSLEARAVPLPDGIDVVVLDTATRRGLVDSEYNVRRLQCEQAAAVLGLPALRDIDPARFAERAHALDPLTRQRARHVVTENALTEEAAAAMHAGDAVRLGELMDASHISLRDDFEVSSPALDLFVQIARAIPGCLGARMTGAGFGGCAVAIVRAEQTSAFTAEAARIYRDRSGHQPRVYVTRPSAGAGLVQHATAAEP